MFHNVPFWGYYYINDIPEGIKNTKYLLMIHQSSLNIEDKKFSAVQNNKNLKVISIRLC